MRKGIVLLWVMACFASFYCDSASSMDISASSAIVMDTVTGRILFEKNAYQKRPMASTTKIMTAIIAIESGNPDDIVTTSAKAAHIEGSSIWLEEGEKQKLIDLIYGIMLSSGNDAAVAVAEHVGGSVEGFAHMMNKKAQEIGAVNTSFKNPSGLDEEGHYTTAYDLALITRYALKNNTFAEIVKTWEKKIPWQGHKWDRVLQNHNKLLKMYEGCDGVKTGYTKKSGRCLVSSATRNGWQVIAVTLNAPNDWEDHKKMLDYAFNNYALTTLCSEGDYMKTLPVKDGKQDVISLAAYSDFKIPLKEDELGKVEIQYDVPDFITAPVSYGQKIGKISVLLEGNEIGEVPLVSVNSVDKKDIRLSYMKIVRNWLIMFISKYAF
ncbi:MAG: D-alanyl-D-alanine carboxypeptidase [Clostridiaceae bacterium]|nr:D-alanyl-D-alanine carboxypeptidase [Clostridiaceae bacterium]